MEGQSNKQLSKLLARALVIELALAAVIVGMIVIITLFSGDVSSFIYIDF